MSFSLKKLITQVRYPWTRVFYREFRRWRRDKMENVRMGFDTLKPDANVFDMGGFEGNWAASIHDRYGSRVSIFEPHPHFAKNIEKRFADNDKVSVYDFGLGSVSTPIKLSDDGDASSSVKSDDGNVIGRIEAVSDFFDRISIPRVDVMKINIEGGEYDLLPALIDKGIISQISLLQIQFHLFSEGDIRKRDAIRSQLLLTHVCDWSYDFVWEQWSLRAGEDADHDG